MASEYLYADITGTTGIEAVTVSDSHTSPSSNAIISAENTTLDIGSAVTIDLGYVGDYSKVFSGYVKNIELKEPEMKYTISCANVMIRAADYFIASTTPDNPVKYNHIAAETLVENVLAMAGLTNYGYDPTSFTFGINTEVEVNLTSAYDYAHFIGSILAYTVYADKDGKSWFKNRRPYVMPGDVSVATLEGSDILDISYTRSDKDLRNRIVVYGSEGINAEAKASSPYVPSGFYRTVLVSAPGVIDTQSMADMSADYNLDLLNRLTKRVSMTIVGNHNIDCRNVVTVNRPSIGVSGDWFVYGLEHNWSNAGFMTGLELRS